MKTNEFIKKNGLDFAKDRLDYCKGARLTKNERELKRLVESHEIVEKYNLGKYSALENAKAHTLVLALIEEDEQLERLQQAIVDVESCL